jgi:hypothetical protein
MPAAVPKLRESMLRVAKELKARGSTQEELNLLYREAYSRLGWVLVERDPVGNDSATAAKAIATANGNAMKLAMEFEAKVHFGVGLGTDLVDLKPVYWAPWQADRITE